MTNHQPHAKRELSSEVKRSVILSIHEQWSEICWKVHKKGKALTRERLSPQKSTRAFFSSDELNAKYELMQHIQLLQALQA